MKIYKKTLIISIIVFCICVALSIVLKFTCIAKFNAIAFLTDYMIGIACSVIVVIITTFLQFKYEQRKLLNSILSDVQFFFFHYLLIAMSLDPNEKIPDKLWEQYYDEVCDSVKKISLQLSNVQWFSKNKAKITNDLQKASLRIRIGISEYANKKDALVHIIYTPSFKAIKDNALLLANPEEYTAKEIIENYQEIQQTLQELENKNCEEKE